MKIINNRLIFKISLLFLSLIFSLLLCELLLRLINYNYTPLRIETIKQQDEWRYYHAFEDRHFEYDPNLFWRPKKGYPPFNSQGFRGPEINSDKHKDHFVIFAIGDSNTLGWIGNGDYSWPNYLQDIFIKEGEKVRVINAGVYGYSSLQGQRYFEEVAKFKPDMVFISFGWNDSLQVVFSDLEFTKNTIRSMKIDQFLYKFKTGQVILDLLDSSYSGKNKKLVKRVGTQEYKDNLIKIIDSARQKDIQVILLTRPTEEDIPLPYDSITIEIAKEYHIPIIDVYRIFKGKYEYFDDISHFNEDGHRHMARILYQNIKHLL